MIEESALSAFSKYKENKNAESARELILYLYIVLRESYRFSDEPASKKEVYYAENDMKKALSAASKLDETSYINNMWQDYLGGMSLSFEKAKRQSEVDKLVSLAVSQKLKSLEETIGQAEKRSRNVEEKVNHSLKSNNFVVLSKGFESLKEDIKGKMKPLQDREEYLKWFVITSSIVFVLFKGLKTTTFDQLPSLLAPAVFIGILVYFLRLTLSEKRVEQKRVHEIENKIAVIAFIEEYVKFYSDNKNKSEDVMNSFNQMIFHPIHNDAGYEQEPKLHDALEEIVKVLRK